MSAPSDGRFAVFGNPAAHSLSPRLHALFAAQCGKDIAYEAICAPVDGFAAALHSFIAAGGRGANVTVPFKEEAFYCADSLSQRARAAGAVNTLTLADGRLHGDNTDGVGLLRDLEQNLAAAISGRRLLLLGAGGAARGVAAPLLAQGPAQMFIANRTQEKAQQLAADFGVAGGGFAALAGRSFDIVINATAAGLTAAPLPLADELFAPGCLAYEMLYGRETAFMSQAGAAGARVADGLGMLVEQGAEAFFVWHGVRPATAAALAQLRR